MKKNIVNRLITPVKRWICSKDFMLSVVNVNVWLINQEVTMFISYLRNEEIMKYNDDWIHEDSGIQICLDDFKLPKHLRNITTLENSMYCVVWNSIIKSFWAEIHLLFHCLCFSHNRHFVYKKQLKKEVWLFQH